MRIRKNANVALQILAAAVDLLDPSLVETTQCHLNQSPWDAISPVQLDLPNITTDGGIHGTHGNNKLDQPEIAADNVIQGRDGNNTLAKPIGTQERGSSKENPIVIFEEESSVVLVEEENPVVIAEEENPIVTVEENRTEIIEEANTEDVDVPLLVVFGNKRNTEKCYKNKSMPPPKDKNALHKSDRVIPKSVDLPAAKKIYKPRARKPALVFDENGYYYYSGFAPSKRGSSSQDNNEEKTRL